MSATPTAQPDETSEKPELSFRHEFRTPLTLMLGPLEEALTEAALLPDVRQRLDVAHRNSVRLLKLVNTLATFTIRLPIMGLSDADAAQRGESKQLIDSRWKQKAQAGDDDVLPTLLSGLKVLAVDDQQDTRDLIMLALMRYGADVRASDSATAALATVAEWQPNVIVSDIGLPENGRLRFHARAAQDRR